MKKSNYTYVWVSLIVLIFGIIFIPRIINRLKEGTTTELDHKIETAGSLSYVVLNDIKRTVPEFSFVNQDSLLITNKDYLGKVFVVEFFFTTCPSICPIMNTNLVKVQNELESFDDFGIASFTINPEYDTPRVLKEYAELYGIKNLDWHLLTGSKEAIYDLANRGFNIFAAEDYRADGGFEHSGNVALIDREGFLRSRKDQYGNVIAYYDILEEEGLTMLKEDIAKLLKEE
ncbi:redoxin domain-containing protein [Flavobacteriaceae bacterium R38]|nr:redoxin domain-containing protein [Flavobacteriaceae bacterium R38]